MRIGINLLYLIPGVVGGTETYAKGLLYGLSRIEDENEYVVFVNREARDWPLPAGGKFMRVVCPVKGSFRPGRYFYEQLVFPSLVREHQVDILHSLGYVGPTNVRCTSLVTIHDLNYLVIGEAMSRSRRMVLQMLVKRSAWNSTAIITISEFSKREIVTRLLLPPGRVVVIHEGPGRIEDDAGGSEVTGSPGRPYKGSDYLLSFSSESPHKNIAALLKAFSLVTRNIRAPLRLILIGRIPLGTELTDLVATLGLEERVVFTGYVRDGDLNDLLAGSMALVFPSLYEGFGLPVLEAMARGVPVVSSNRGALPEVGGDAAVYFDAGSAEDMATQITAVVKDPELRKKMSERGFENVRRFSWTETARKTLEVYGQACQRKVGAG